MRREVAVKVCGLTTVDNTRAVAQCNIDYVGLVCHPASRRHVTFEQAYCLAEICRDAGKDVVVVVVNQSMSALEAIIHTIQPGFLQLHGDVSQSAYPILRGHQRCIIPMGYQLTAADVEQSDILLYDAPQPGSGDDAHLCSLQPDRRHQFFVAGGVSPENVCDIVSRFKPSGIDLSTHVESAPGIKSLDRIQLLLDQLET